MKTNNLKSIWLVLVMLCTSIGASAYSFEVDGIYYNITSSTDLTCGVTYRNTNYNSYSGNVTIPSVVTYNSKEYKVTSIGSNAFRSCSNLTAVNIPEGVTSIGSYAFYNCYSLTAVNIKSIAAWCNINFEGGSNPLYYAQNLYLNGELVTNLDIPEGVTSIGSYAFLYCSSLTAVNIPESVTNIGSYAFYYCSSLTAVNIPEGVTSIGSYAFRDCSSLTAVNIPEGVTNIGDGAFNGCSSLTAVNIPEGVTNIESYAFSGCSSLTAVNIPEGVTNIGSYAFHHCSSLTAVNIPEGVTNIGSYAFQDCSSLTAVNIPEGVTNIGDDAFNGCSSLTAVNIPESVTSIGSAAFHHCYSLTAVNIPESVTNIESYAFSGCSSLTAVNIPESVTNIGSYAFSGFVGEVNINSNSPATLGSSAFNDSYIVVPDNALEAYKSAWSECADKIFPKIASSITANVTATDGHPALLNAIGGVGSEDKVVKLKINGTINGYDIMLLRNKLTNLAYLDLTDATIVPEKDNYQYYTGYYTKENVLGGYSFYDVNNLKTIILPNNITSIGSYAFAECDNLLQILNIPESCTNIEASAFYNDRKLIVCDISNGRKDIGSYAFYNCTNLKDIVINGNIGSYAFKGSGVTNVTIKKDTKSIGSYAFQSCSSLVNLKFEEGLETIGYYAFRSCEKLNNLRLPSSLKRIESYAFNDCSSLKEIHIPSMLEYIGDYAFESTGATDVYSYTLSPINISQNSFKYAGVTLHAPQEPESVFWDYYLNTQWSQFANVVPFDAKYSTWYTGENQDITLGEDETIPNDEEAEEPSGEMNPGSGIDYKPGSWQWLYELIMKWTGGKYPSLIDNSSVFVDNLTFKLQVSAGKWYFFCFPFDVELEKVKYPGRQKVWRYYDGKERAENSKGGWKNVTEDVLHAGQGYIFQTNKAGEIEITIKNPIFTGGDKQVTISNHTSANVEDASWNFIGNPNLSYYDLGALANDYNCPITVWDPQNNTYNAVMPGDDDYQFHPFEAFFVQKPDDVNSVDFKAENRITSNGAEKVMEARRRARAAMRINENRLLVNLAISNGEQTDKTRVVFNDEKSMDYETACDASKFLSTEAPQIYSLDSKNIKYSINERPKADKTVSLGIYAPAEGVYTISAQRMDCRMALKDNVTGTIHDLSEGDYEFLTEAGTYEARFTLIPNEEEATGIELAKTVGTDATIYSTNGTAVSNSNGQVNSPAGIYVVKEGNKVRKVLVK